MDNLIGYKGTPNTRREEWIAMQTFRAGAIQLLNNPSTHEIALADKDRYSNFLRRYVA